MSLTGTSRRPPSPVSPGEPDLRASPPGRQGGFAYLAWLTDRSGVRERPEVKGFAAPGYRTSDAARALILVLHEYLDSPRIALTSLTYLGFLEQAIRPDGLVYERLGPNRQWADKPGHGEVWGRSVAALGTAARMGTTSGARDRAVKAFLRAAKVRSADTRASALAALGAVAFVRSRTDAAAVARTLLADCLDVIPRQTKPDWGWPEERLAHNNAALCDALIVGGAALGRSVPIRQGLAMLTMLMETETNQHGHLSPTGDLGRSVHESGPHGRQRPTDVAAIADACAHAFAVTGDRHWRQGVWLAWNWFLGLNDLGVRVYDPETGIANDALLSTVRPGGSGTEATLAALSTLQRARDIGA